MERLHPDDRVRLRQHIPELGLSQGQVGIVCSTWFSPAVAYEVEFGLAPCGGSVVRALLLAGQVERLNESGARNAVDP